MSKNTQFLLAVGVLGLLGLAFWLGVLQSKETEPTVSATTKDATCEYLGIGTVEEIDKSSPGLRDAGFEVAVVKITKDSTTNTGQLEWKVLVPTAMVFVQGNAVDLCGLYYQAHPMSAHFIPIITHRPLPTK